MKICIVTVYNSYNYGSYLQAYALKRIIEKNNEVYFANTKTRSIFKAFIKASYKNIKKKNLLGLIFELKKSISFLSALNNFSKIKLCNLNEDDICIFGSDELWNISRKEFLKYPVFWGEGISSRKKIAYAISINNTSVEQLINSMYPMKYLYDFVSIGMRDKKSIDILQSCYNRDYELVVDPTMLLAQSVYNNIEILPKDDSFIMIYSYGYKFDADRVKIVKKLASEKKLKLISVGFYLDWCDKSIGCSPFEFLGFVRKAAYIITDTFHGTIFSIIYNKKFVSIGGDNSKINELLMQFNLSNRNLQDTKDLGDLIDLPIDFYDVNNKLEKWREKSLIFLEESICRCTDVNMEKL